MHSIWQAELHGIAQVVTNCLKLSYSTEPTRSVRHWMSPGWLDLHLMHSLSLVLYLQVKMISDPRQIGGRQTRAEATSGMTASVLDMFGCGANVRR